MTSLALADTNGSLSLLEPQLKAVRDRLRASRALRRRTMEGHWQLNLAFAGGSQWLGWHDRTRTLRAIQELDPRYKGRELVTADVITEYRTTALGELGSDNDRPELMLRRDDLASEDYQQQLNRALGYAWDQELDADDVLAQVDRYLVDLGTAAVQCQYDPNEGPVAYDNIPHLDGRPVMDPGQASQLFQNGPNPAVSMQAVRQGKLCWRPLSPFQILPPVGCEHEKKFPFDAILTTAYLPNVKERYGSVASELLEDKDITTTLGIAVASAALDPVAMRASGDSAQGRLKDHVWLFSYYERPTKQFPQGREITFAGNDLKLLEYKEQLPYVAPDGTYRSGIAYFHWWRVTGRFFSRSLVDVLRQGQFGINKRRTQINEIIDKNMPFVIVQTDSKAKRRVGMVNEIVEIDANEKAPVPVPGAGPGPWMQADVESLREDLTHASGISGPRRGENPQNVSTYSQLALLNEQDTAKREPIYLERKRSIGQLVEDTVYDIRTYWGKEKQLALAGDDNQLEAATFDATKIPPFFIVEIGKGSAKPRSQAAELQKITDIWNAAALATAVQQNPQQWVEWYKASIEAGEALELPAAQVEDPAEKAEYENHYMQQGVAMPIAYYDIHAIHLPRHRQAQDQAMFTQDMATWNVIEQHCQLHINAAQAQAAAQLQQMQGGPPGAPPAASSAGVPVRPPTPQPSLPGAMAAAPPQ